jgi:preprotein translocase subunit SecF
MQFLKNPNFDFVGRGPLFLGISAVLVVASLALVLRPNGVRYGVEFSGGTQVIAKFEKPPEIDRVRDAVEKTHHGAVIQTFGATESNQVLIRVGTVGEGEVELASTAEAVLKSLATDYSQNPVKETSTEIVGAVVGKELRDKAVVLTVVGLLFQLIYIWWRFKGPVWGSAATIAVFHDVIITLGLLALFKHEITLNVIAALLTLVGYSVNDTIVLFDRVRENLRQRRKEPLSKIINDSVNQTLSRTLISNGTTFLTVFGLFWFGGEVFRGFGFAMVVGVLVGTYSTVYIASPIVIWWHRFSGKGATAGTGASAVKAAL